MRECRRGGSLGGGWASGVKLANASGRRLRAVGRRAAKHARVQVRDGKGEGNDGARSGKADGGGIGGFSDLLDTTEGDPEDDEGGEGRSAGASVSCFTEIATEE